MLSRFASLLHRSASAFSRSLLTLPLALGLLLGSATLSLGDEAKPAAPAPAADKKTEQPADSAKPTPAAKPAPAKVDEKKDDKKDDKKADSKSKSDETVRSLAPVDKAAWNKPSPESVADLKAIQDRVQEVVKISLSRVVGLRVGQASGSGVIISKEGYVLTAGHVSATPNRQVDIILQDGKVVKGKSLGRNTGIDSGLIKIDDGQDWDFAEMGDSDSLKQGQWCLAIGHPGGYQRGRPPVVRIGRIISATDRVIWTDATLVGGDSGGPLFDMDGKVIAIHSRISAPTSNNFHVPVETYRKTWDRLAAGEDWTDRSFNIGSFAGFNAEPDAKGARITGVAENSPATLAGLKVGDVITNFDGAKVRNLNQVTEAINKKRPNEPVTFELIRDSKPVKGTITLAAGFKAGPFIGVSGQSHEKGVLIDSLVPGTPADTAKMQKDDVITKFDGAAVKDLEALQSAIGRKKPGDSAEVEILRGAQTLKLKVVLGLRG